MALQVGELYASFGIDTSGVDKALANIEKKLSSVGKNMALSGAAMTAAVTAPLVKIGKDIFKTGSDFGEAMSRVFATADLNKAIVEDQKNMDALTEKALEMGSTTKFTSSEAAEALNYMAMAGWKTNDMLSGLAPIMNLAAASGEELGLVSDIVTDALTAFGKDAGYAKDFVDILAKTASNANTNVAMLGESFKYAAPMAGAMGYSVEDIAVALGIMANSGIKASQAGTTLRTMFTRMSGTDKKVVQTMKDLNLSMTNADGTMRPLNEVLADLRESFANLTEEEKVQAATTLAGRNAVSGFMALINASEKDFNDLTNAINNSGGAAERMSKVALDNAAGDITYFKSAVDGAKISLWQLTEGPFRAVVQKATGYVNAFNNMEAATKKGVLRTGAFMAAIGPATAALGGLVKLLPTLTKGMRLAFGWQGIVATGLIALGAAAMDADNSIGKTFESISKTVGEKTGQIADYIASHSQQLTANAGNFLASLKTSIDNALPNLLQAGADILVALLDGISLNVDKILQIGESVVISVKNAIVANAGNIVPAALQLLQNIIVGIVTEIPFLLQNGGEIVLAIGEALLTADWEGIGSGIWTAIDGALKKTKAVLSNFGATIKEKFGVSSWTDLAAKLWVDLAAAVKSMAGRATTLVTNILNGLADSDMWNKSGTTFAVIANTLVTELGKAIPGIFENAKSLLKAGINLGNKIVEGINTALTQMSADNMGTKLADAAIAILKGLLTLPSDLSSVDDFITKLGEAFSNAMGLLGDFAGKLIAWIFSEEGFSKILSAGEKIGGLLLHGIESILSGIGNFFVHLIDNALISWGLVDEEENKIYRQAESTYKKYVDKVQDAYSEAAKSFKGGDGNLLDIALLSLVGGNQANFKWDKSLWDFGEIYGLIDDSIQAYFDENNTGAVQSFQEWSDAFWLGITKETSKEDIQARLNEFLGALGIKDIPSEMAYIVSDAIAGYRAGTGFGNKEWFMANILAALGLGDTEGVEEAKQEVVEQVDDVVETYKQEIAELTKGANTPAQVSKDATDAMTQTLVDAKDTVGTAAQEIPDDVVQRFLLTMSAENGTQIATTFTSAIQTSLEEAHITLTTLSETIASDVKAKFEGILTSASGSSIGYMFGQGLAEGIGNSVSIVEAAASTLGESAVEALRTAIDAHSPSREAWRAGLDFAQGYEFGQYDGLDGVRKSAEDLAEASLKALQEKGYGTGSHSRLPSVTVPGVSSTPLKDLIKAAEKQTSAAQQLANAATEATSVSTRSHSTSAQSAYGMPGSSYGTAVSSSVSGGNQPDQSAQYETYARIVAAALDGCKVELYGEEVGSLVAPVVSEVIASQAIARRNGTI